MFKCHLVFGAPRFLFFILLSSYVGLFVFFLSAEIQSQNDTQASFEIEHRFGCGHCSSQKKNPNKEKYFVESLTITMVERIEKKILKGRI